jgi:peptide-methionine (R)-S-oxide reductase
MDKVKKSDSEWQKELTPEQYAVTRQAGTERAFTGPYWDEHSAGTYHCIACGQPLFRSETKYDSGSGWPSFFKPIEKEVVAIREDVSHGMRRVEVLCSKCDSHLGHLFPDGPQPTGQRFCMNGTALKLDKDGEKKK